MAPKQIPGVFCLEAEWESDLRRKSTIKPLLDVLEGQRLIDFIYKDVGTREEVEHYSKIWTQKRYEKYRLLYVASHGDPGVIKVGRNNIEIEEIGEWLDGRAKGAVVYFAGCATVAVPNPRLDTFLKLSGAKAVCGYSVDVDWLESTAFDLLIIEALTRYKRIDAAERWLRKEYASTVRRLKFKIRRA
jgi:hypothetical protein